ncbi:MAG: hypothetical protein K6G23_09210, partial [Lachnospiraceae bacterium]|nr:hypothetical protein [Lachnospiraceae bacterium]
MSYFGYEIIVGIQLACIMTQFVAIFIVYGQKMGLLRDMKFLTCVSCIAVTVGYIWVLQGTEIHALQIAYKIYYAGVSAAPIFFLFAVHALYERPIKNVVKIAIVAVGLCEQVFLYLDGLTYYLYTNARMGNNLIFCYLEADRSGLYFVFRFYMIAVLASIVYVIYREKKERIALGIYDQKVKRLNVKLGLILALQMLALAVYELELT